MKKQTKAIVKISNSLSSPNKSSSLSNRGLQDLGISSEVEKLLNKMDMHIIHLEFEKAIVIDKKILSIDPANIRANFNLGFCNQRLKRYEKAIHHYNKTLQLDKNHLLALTNKAMVLSDIGNTDSQKTWEELLRAGTDMGNKSVVNSALHNLGRFQESLQLCDEVLLENPSDLDGLYYKALGLMETHQYIKATETADILLSFHPSNIYALHIKGEVYLKNNIYGEALDVYTHILEILPDDPEALRALRKIAENMKQGNDEKEDLN